MSKRHLFALIPLALSAVLVASARPVRSLPSAGRTVAAVPQSDEQNLAAARAVLEAQQAAWNRGDVAGYMEGYAKEESTTFISGDSLTRGWRPVLERYKARYDTREKMGTLAFTELEFKALNDGYILATGRWRLTLKGDSPHGRFTLVFRRTGEGWRVVHDHTSSAS